MHNPIIVHITHIGQTNMWHQTDFELHRRIMSSCCDTFKYPRNNQTHHCKHRGRIQQRRRSGAAGGPGTAGTAHGGRAGDALLLALQRQTAPGEFANVMHKCAVNWPGCFRHKAAFEDAGERDAIGARLF